MTNKPIVIMNTMDCPPEDDEEFNKWYTKHASALFKFKGMKSITRYKKIGEDPNVPLYVAIYHFDKQEDLEQYLKSPEREAGIKIPGRPESVKIRFHSQFEIMQEWKK